MSRRLIILLFWMVLIIIPITMEAQNMAEQDSSRASSGERVPIIPFSCFDIDSNEVDIRDFKGKVVYLDIWATWCLPCRMQFPKMKDLKEEYHDKEVVFLYVSVDLDREKWVRFLERKEPSGVHLIADDHFQTKFSDFYQIYGIPRFMLVDKKGLLYSSDANRPGWDEVRDDLNLLLAE